MTKIIGVGWQKTGTTTLGVALSKLGLNAASWTRETSLLYKRGQSDLLLELTDEFDAFDDFPWLFFYNEIYERHPGSKFILTTRKDIDTWYNSARKHRQRARRNAFNLDDAMYDGRDIEDRDAIIAIYEKHVTSVRQFAEANSIPMLEVCWENGDGWNELCSFVGRDVPDAPFPHANAAPQKRKPTLLRRVKRRLLG